jgi:beta-glucosidase
LALAREAGRKSIVLLRNQQNILPLSKNLKKVAVIGPLGDNTADLLGSWFCKGEAKDVVSLLSGLKSAAPGITYTFAQGCDFNGNSTNTKTEDKSIEEAVKTAKSADVVILAVGENKGQSGEAASRSSIGLPGRQEELAEKIIATGKPVVVVLMNGRPLAIPFLAEHAPALVEAWQLGVQAGPAIADILFGDYAPTGRLTVSFPRAVGQEPLYYSRRNTGRPPVDKDLGEQKWTSKYIDVPWTPQFPFGYGLTYTTFKYANLHVTPTVKMGGTVEVTVEVTNTGTRDGEELVQLYIHQVAASMTRPVRELKDFQHVALKAGETKSVTFQLPTSKLSFLGEDLKPRVEPGSFKVWAAPNASEGIEGSFSLSAK